MSWMITLALDSARGVSLSGSVMRQPLLRVMKDLRVEEGMGAESLYWNRLQASKVGAAAC